MLSADPDHRPGGQRAQRRASRPERRRQFRNPRADRGRPLRRPLDSRAEACCGLRGRQFLQFPVRRQASRYRPVLRQLSHRGLGLEAPHRRRRQSYPMPDQRELPEHARRSVRDAFPWLVEEYSLAKESGGHGRTRGGHGCVRILRVEAPEITVSSFMDRHSMRAWGLFGGEQGEQIWVYARRGERMADLLRGVRNDLPRTNSPTSSCTGVTGS